MRAPGEGLEHAASVIRGAGFAKDAAVERDDGVGSNDDGGTDSSSGDEFGFGFSEALDHVGGRFVGKRRFIDGRRDSLEREASVAKDFGAARRCGGEDEFHEEGEQ